MKRNKTQLMKFILLNITCIAALFSISAFVPEPQPSGSLQYIVRRPKVNAGKPPLLILLHGIGSNEQDLFSFSDQLPGKYLVISARGPFPWGDNKFAWYSIDFSTPKNTYNFEEEEQSRKMIIDFISKLKMKYTYDEQQVYLCGFSQGAMMSYTVALTRPDLVHGIAIMSGRLLEEIKPKVAPKEKLKQLKVFISHGTNDSRISIQQPRAAVAYLKSLGVTPAYKEYKADHEINAEMLGDLITWLK